ALGRIDDGVAPLVAVFASVRRFTDADTVQDDDDGPIPLHTNPPNDKKSTLLTGKCNPVRVRTQHPEPFFEKDRSRPATTRGRFGQNWTQRVARSTRTGVTLAWIHAPAATLIAPAPDSIVAARNCANRLSRRRLPIKALAALTAK